VPRSDDFVPFIARRIERQPCVDVAPPADVAGEEAEARRPHDDETQTLPPPPSRECDPPPGDAAARELAIRLAGIACARALHEAVARNPLFVARFVDDALQAFGDAKHARVRLRTVEAAACANTIGCDVVADDALAPGEVVVQSEGGALRASIEARAARLVRAAADA
jgi:hypothetical protein